MPTPNEETRRKCSLIKGRFTGDPSHEYEHSEKNLEDDPDKEEEPDVVSIVVFSSELFMIIFFVILKYVL